MSTHARLLLQPLCRPVAHQVRMSSSASLPLQGKVCLVTGASRGLGKGIALQLGQAGATVYITGRTLKSRPGTPGSLTETAEEVQNRGGRCYAIECDHSKDEDIKRLFDQIERNENGQLDILVNNAYAAVNHIAENFQNKFWEQDPEVWDIINNVGLRVYAGRLMVPRKSGLIVNVSSAGGIGYLFSAAYGIGKVACDRMAVDCAQELRKHNVAFISLWPGTAKTEIFMDLVKSDKLSSAKVNARLSGKELKGFIERGESTEFSGKAIVALYKDQNLMSKSGKVHLTIDLSDEYGFKDIDGTVPANFRSLRYWVAAAGYTGIAGWIPGWLKAPKKILWMQASHL